MRRLLSLFLAFIVCMTAFGTSSFAVADSAHIHYDDCTNIPEFYNSSNTSAVDYWNSIKALLPTGTKSTINNSGSYYPFNFKI